MLVWETFLVQTNYKSNLPKSVLQDFETTELSNREWFS